MYSPGSLELGSIFRSVLPSDGLLRSARGSHQPAERATNLRNQSRGDAPLNKPQDIRLTGQYPGFALRHVRIGRFRFRLLRAQGPRQQTRTHAALHSPQTCRTQSPGLIVRDEFASGTEPQNWRRSGHHGSSDRCSRGNPIRFRSVCLVEDKVSNAPCQVLFHCGSPISVKNTKFLPKMCSGAFGTLFGWIRGPVC